MAKYMMDAKGDRRQAPWWQIIAASALVCSPVILVLALTGWS